MSRALHSLQYGEHPSLVDVRLHIPAFRELPPEALEQEYETAVEDIGTWFFEKAEAAAHKHLNRAFQETWDFSHDHNIHIQGLGEVAHWNQRQWMAWARFLKEVRALEQRFEKVFINKVMKASESYRENTR